ncbi:MAG: hypothetical protein QOF26_2403 [Baekduia sp.]|jgi:hypothetical protein|nr:hypothetical protein [Baekduia sp.]MDX6702177.1 hypothetical protein [Baekduia sp.]
MDAERHRSSEAAGLELCSGCHRPFVVPVALLDLVDEGLYLLALHCSNCDRLSTGIFEDAELELLERANESAIAEMEVAIELIEVACFIDDLASFARALESDLLLPEDF